MVVRHERLWLQLRTCEGIALQPSELRILLSAPKFQAMLEAGLVHLQALRLHLTPSGFLLADAIGVEVLTILEHAHGHG
jgi:coproporphyrinogen III oxidase-like Fe-S oxidoreductase